MHGKVMRNKDRQYLLQIYDKTKDGDLYVTRKKLDVDIEWKLLRTSLILILIQFLSRSIRKLPRIDTLTYIPLVGCSLFLPIIFPNGVLLAFP